MEHVAPITNAVAWPIIACILILLLAPTIKSILKSRAFTVRVGDTEITVQESTEGIQKLISDLQNQISQLRVDTSKESVDEQDSNLEAPRRWRNQGRTILWVDDRPEANAYERAKLTGDGYTIIRSTTTSDALVKLSSGLKPFAIISDMERAEDGVRVKTAGLELLKAVRDSDDAVPFFIYTSTRTEDEFKKTAIESNASGITSSSLTLIQSISELSLDS